MNSDYANRINIYALCVSRTFSNPRLLGTFEKLLRLLNLSLRIEEYCEDSLNLQKLLRISSGEELIQFFP